jgi:hypothetical protein
MSQQTPTSPRPVAVGYARDGVQRVEVQGYAEAQGYRLVEVVEDRRDTATISQIAQHARDAQAHVVILPGAALLSAARNRLEKELARLGAACVVLGAPNSPTSAVFERVMPRRDLDTAATGKHSRQRPAGRHQASGTTDDT